MALNAKYNNIYKLGDQATYVKEIIKKLNELSYHCGTPDIYYTSLVAQRVKDFQGDHGLTKDGKVGPLTHKNYTKPHQPRTPGRYCAKVHLVLP